MVIIDILKWYLVLTGIGILGFPIAFAFLKKLPGRGFVFARSAGLILISYVYWLFGTLGFLRNEAGSLFCVTALIAAAAVFIWRKQRDEIRIWLQNSNRSFFGANVIKLCKIHSYRLFADNILSGFCRLNNKVMMLIVVCSNDNHINFRIIKHFLVVSISFYALFNVFKLLWVDI